MNIKNNIKTKKHYHIRSEIILAKKERRQDAGICCRDENIYVTK
jgi:hypothetical protein